MSVSWRCYCPFGLSRQRHCTAQAAGTATANPIRSRIYQDYQEPNLSGTVCEESH
jgi:hypothetical protein